MSDKQCPAHSGLEAKIDGGFSNLDKTLKSMDERLTRIESKIEPLSTIGHMADTNRKWLSWLTGGIVTILIKQIFWR
jgi:hypothetical protein